MAVTQEDLDKAQAGVDALNQCIDDGVRQVTLPGGQVTIYNTTESLFKARNDAEARLRALRNQQAAETGAGPRKAPQRYLTYGGRAY